MHKHNTAKRRQDVMDLMGDGVAIIGTNPHQQRNADAYFPFRPNSDFFYLTGFHEPEAIVVLIPNREAGEYILFCQGKDPLRELWDGKRVGIENACREYGADHAYDIHDFEEIMPKLLENQQKVYTFPGRNPELDAQLFRWARTLKQNKRSGLQAPTEFSDISQIVHELRLIKDKDELKTMRKAARISAQGHLAAMRACKPGLMEYQVQADLEREFQYAGAQSVAYTSIVASGASACILHYIENNGRCQDGDLLLIDAGAEVDCYAADITRTFPVNGKFSGPQRDCYEVVLAAQQAAIDTLKPGVIWNDYHQAAVATLSQGLIDLGIIKANLEQTLEQQLYKAYYMHGTGHWLGMDVHDCGDYKIEEQWRLLEPGMVLTVEPGLYMRPSADLDEKWHNIGIRIEDDAIITHKGCDIITRDVPVTVDEIEAVMRG